MKTKDIFGHIIRYMKQRLLDDLKTRGNTVKEDNILWVVTVPAIWNDGAKQFMREAALAVKDVIQTFMIFLHVYVSLVDLLSILFPQILGFVNVRYSSKTRITRSVMDERFCFVIKMQFVIIRDH